MVLNGHTLFPDPPNWREDPEWQRDWQTDVLDGVTGAELRSSFRSVGRRSLSWTSSPKDLESNTRLDDAIRAAKKSGLAAVPHWGCASVLLAPCNATAAVLQDSAWPWMSGDYVYLRDAAGNYETAQVSGVVGQILGEPAAGLGLGDGDSVLGDSTLQLILTLTVPVSRSYAAGLQVWPILFGKFNSDDIEAQVSHRGEVRLTIQERINPASIQLGQLLPPSYDGIGVFIIGSTFVNHVVVT